VLALQRTLGNRAVHHLLAPASPTATRLAIQREVVDDAAKTELTAEEIRFFEARPAVAQAEAQLQALMRGEGRLQGPVQYELGLIYKGGVLQQVLKGNAAKPGANAQVKVSPEALQAAGGGTDLVVTHNHPGGAPLSRGDVSLAVDPKRNLQEIRATGQYGSFAVGRRTTAWGKVDTGAVFDAYARGEAAWSGACAAADRDLRPRDPAAPDMGETFAKDNFMAKHYACRLLRDTFGAVVAYAHPDEAVLIAARRGLYEERDARPDDSRAGWSSTQDLIPGGTPKS
jgi:hypothetical protein